MSAFESFLTELGKIVDLPGLKPDRFGACLLIMKKEGAHLLFEFDESIVPGTFLVSTPLMELGSNQNTVLTQALCENKSLDATLSYKEDEHMLYLHRRFNQGIEASEIKPLLDRFLASYVHYQNFFTNPSYSKTSEQAPPTEESAPPQMQFPPLHFKA